MFPRINEFQSFFQLSTNAGRRLSCLGDFSKILHFFEFTIILVLAKISMKFFHCNVNKYVSVLTIIQILYYRIHKIFVPPLKMTPFNFAHFRKSCATKFFKFINNIKYYVDNSFLLSKMLKI